MKLTDQQIKELKNKFFDDCTNDSALPCVLNTELWQWIVDNVIEPCKCEEKIIDNFCCRLLTELNEFKYDTSTCDGDDLPEEIIANWVHNLVEEAKDTAVELSEKAHDITLDRLLKCEESKKGEEWISVKDDLPEKSGEVLICVKETKDIYVSFYKKQQNVFIVYGAGAREITDIKTEYWQLLPTPPTNK